MKFHSFFRAFFALALGLSALMAGPSARPVYAAVSTLDIYTDALVAGWDNWSWTTVDLQSTAYAHSGMHSIAVTYSAWGGLQLHYPELDTTGFSYLRFFINGGAATGQKLQVYALTDSGTNGPAVPVTVTGAAGTWAEVDIPLSQLGLTNTTFTGLVWQGTTSSSQPTLYIDDIALAVDVDANAPTLSAAYLLPRGVPADGTTQAIVRVLVGDPQGLSDVISVTLDGSSIGRGLIPLHDDGWSNDGTAGDGVYGAAFTVPPGTPAGEHTLVVSAQDNEHNVASLRLGDFDVYAAPGGKIPATLPPHIGWGTDAWDDSVAGDWQGHSGVPWNYEYQYITWGWDQGGWGTNFVQGFVSQAWSKGYVPLISVYMMLGLNTDGVCTTESPACYAQKLQDAGAVSAYLSSLKAAASQAKGSRPVIFHLEPDFYGYMQQWSNNSSRPAGIRPDDPASYPVALNVAGYPNNLAGFGRRMVDLIHATAPNALVAPAASMWATNADPNTSTQAGAIQMGQRTAAFINAMGGTQADLIVTEWSDRDAGSGLRPWWDDTNQTLPRYTRTILWENALSAASGKRLMLWQIPLGNMSLNNTCNQYQDNRVAYAFQHPRDLVDAGVFAVLFGGGANCMTDIAHGGPFLAAQGAIAYGRPSAPTGLAAGAARGPIVPLHWTENTEPDLWGYQVTYHSATSGYSGTVIAGRANALNVLLPQAGVWHLAVAAYDAMGQLGPASGTIAVTITVDAHNVYLPLAER